MFLLVGYSESEPIHVPYSFAQWIVGEPYPVQPIAWEGSNALSHVGYDLDVQDSPQPTMGLVAHRVSLYNVPLADLGLAKVDLPMRARITLGVEGSESIPVVKEGADVSGEPADG